MTPVSLPGVLAPVFVQVALCYALLAGLVGSRAVAGRTGQPGASARIGASYANQFEMPVLFFALVALELVTGSADRVFVVLEWTFVILRLAQAAVHVTVNIIPLRGACFALGASALALAWIRFAVHMLA